MILFDGKTYESSEQDRLLTELENKIPEILSKQQLSPEVVIDAVEQLRADLLKGKADLTIFWRSSLRIRSTHIRSRQKHFYPKNTCIKNLRPNLEILKNTSLIR